MLAGKPIPDYFTHLILEMIDKYNLPPLSEKYIDQVPLLLLLHQRGLTLSMMTREQTKMFNVLSEWIGAVPYFTDKQYDRVFKIKEHMIDTVIKSLACVDIF